jgi:hypothetical protein
MDIPSINRLPGVRFEAEPPRLEESLPRMDIVAFVGFASSGPLHIPVAIEDMTGFRRVFGEDLALAHDPANGRLHYSHLASAVESFFRNGGRRCWVVRVAGNEARANFFPIPALAMAEFDQGGVLKRITPAFAPARSEGSWSDGLQVSATLLRRPVQVTQISSNGRTVALVLSSDREVIRGSLLRIDFPDEGNVLLLPLRQINLLPQDSVSNSILMEVTEDNPLWLRTSLWTSPPTEATKVSARVFTRERADLSSALLTPDTDAKHGDIADHFESDEISVLTKLDWHDLDVSQSITFDLALSLANAPPPGSLIRVDVGDNKLWLTVTDLGVGKLQGEDTGEIVRVTGKGFWVSEEERHFTLSGVVGEILTSELWVRKGNEVPIPMSDLGFTPEHSRFWGSLPTDKEFHQQSTNWMCAEMRGDLAREKERLELKGEAAERDFPLSGIDAQGGFSFPVHMEVLPQWFLGPARLSGTQLERDGLSQFNAGLFLDSDMIGATTATLMPHADFLRYLGPSPRRLKGIHAALCIEEVTIIAVPDVVHRSWSKSEKEPPLKDVVLSPPARPNWWHFLDCDPAPKIPHTSEPQWGHFLECDLWVLPAPRLYKLDEPDRAGTFTLRWTSELTGTTYVLEESARPDFDKAVSVYAGAEDYLVIYGRSPGEYYYRVRAEMNGVKSDWSNGVGVRVSIAPPWQMEAAESYSSDALLAVHRALLRMCAARGDLFAVLTLPDHYRADEAKGHAEALKSPDAPPLRVDSSLQSPLNFGERVNLSYGAVYHPWLISRRVENAGGIKSAPPDGAICGVMAERSLARGAWIAPANEVLRDVVALAPTIMPERRRELHQAQINLIRQEPRGFLALSAETLSVDIYLQPINVRRLLILLKRLALRLGSQYVFEVNSESFRRLVHRSFEGMLGYMYARGALAGPTPSTSFQVITNGSVNTRQSLEQGRFIVELRVAPSLPMKFLTIRLVQTGDRLSIMEGQ